MNRSSRRRGFTLMELLCVIILLGTFGLIAGRLFYATFHLYDQTADAQNQTAVIDASLTTLRADTWSAKRIEVADPHTARLTMPDNRVITWTIQTNDLLRQDANETDRLSAPPGATFATDGIALTLHVKNAASASGDDEMQLPSQINVLEKLAP